MTQLCFDFDRSDAAPVVMPADARFDAICRNERGGSSSGGRSERGRDHPRRLRGWMAFLSGAIAEESVADHYVRHGYELLQTRWRGKSGEIDLIMRKSDLVVFVEVKSSRDFSAAAERINRRQMDRICLAACEFCDTLPSGGMTNMRMDAALVDRFGRIEIVENAFGWQ